jgi:YTH domain-containing protein 1
MVTNNTSRLTLNLNLIYFYKNFSRLFPEDETIEMMPILKKSKEMSKQLREKGITSNFRRPTNPRNGIRPPHRGGRGDVRRLSRGGPRKPFSSSRRLIGGPPPHRKPIFNRMLPMKGRYGSSTTAAAEAYVADYMRNMQNQLPPMPYAPPHDFPGAFPPAFPRYYDGIPTRAPIIPDYPPPALPNRSQAASSTNFDKRSYDEFMWKNSKNRNGGGPSRTSRDSSRGGDKHRSYRR